MTDSRSITYKVAACPECSRAHDYWLRIVTTSRTDEAAPVSEQDPLIFGGKDPVASNSRAWDVSLFCTTKGTWFIETIEVPLSVGEKITSVEQVQEKAVESDWRSSERDEWIKGSHASLQDFSKTMLSTASGGIPVYFAVLKYLGVEHVSGGWQVLSIVPAFILFAAMVAFSAWLRPVGRTPQGIEEFIEFRNLRLKQINRGIQVGMVLFASALLWATVIWLVLLFS